MIDINWRPTERDLRRFALTCAPGLTVLGVVAAWRGDAGGSPAWHHGWFTPGIIWTVAAVVAVLGNLRPRALRGIYWGWMGIAFAIGWVLSHLALGIIFYLMVTPTGLVFRLRRRDPLHRGREPERNTYWVRRPEVTDIRRYLRQF